MVYISRHRNCLHLEETSKFTNQNVSGTSLHHWGFWRNRRSLGSKACQVKVAPMTHAVRNYIFCDIIYIYICCIDSRRYHKEELDSCKSGRGQPNPMTSAITCNVITLPHTQHKNNHNRWTVDLVGG